MSTSLKSDRTPTAPHAADTSAVVGFPSGPPQVPLFKGTQYVGNLLGLADTIVEIIYEALPSTTFTMRSGRSVADTFGLSELSLAQDWLAAYPAVGNPHDAPTPSVLWTTLFDFIQLRTDSEEDAISLVWSVRIWLSQTLDEADEHPPDEVLFRFHLNVITGLMAVNSPDSLLSDELSLADIVQIGNFLYRFRTTFATVLEYSFPELDFAEPLSTRGDDGWSLDVEAVVEVELPSDPADFLNWTLTKTGAELFLHFDRIVLDDATGLALTNPNRDDDGQLRFPFGGSVGDLTVSDVVVNVSIRGELGGATSLSIGPYHKYREAFFTERSTSPCAPCASESLIDLSLSVGSVDLDLNSTALAVLVGLLLIPGEEAATDIADAIKSGLEDLDDFGDVGDAVAGAVAPFLPDAAALHTHDFYKPFTDEHVPFVYDGLRIEGEGQGIHILNDAPEPDDPDTSGDGGPNHLPEPEDLDPVILDEELPLGASNGLPRDILVHAELPVVDAGDPLPKGAGGFSPLGDFVLAADQRPRYLAQLDAAAGISPLREAASRLWLDGVPPAAIAWIRESDVDRKARKVGGRPVSAATLASLKRLSASEEVPRGSFLFATSSQWPATSGTLTSLLVPLENPEATAGRFLEPGPIRFPLQYQLESPLAGRKGSTIDPSWVGLSVNVVAVTNALEVLVASDTLGQSGTVANGDEEIPFRVDLETSQLTVRVDLSGEEDARPVVSIGGITVLFDEEGEASTYTVACKVPMEAFKPDHGGLPDDAIHAFVYNRSQMAAITGGQITDDAYLDQLVYRYFVHLRFVSTHATLTTFTRTAGPVLGSSASAGRATSGSIPTGPDDGIEGVTLQELLLARTARAVLAPAFSVPVVFDPYYARSPVIQSYDAREGWLNVYETHS